MLNMDFRLKVTWVSNICQKIEEVCEDVRDIVDKHAVEYVDFEVQDIGDNRKRIYSDVVQEPLPPLINSGKQELGSEESSVNSFFKSNEYYAIDCPNNQQAHANTGDGNDSGETSDMLKENLHMSTEQNAVKSKPQLLMTLFECGAQAGKEECSDGNAEVEQDSCAVVEENNIKLSTPQVLDFWSLGESEQLEASTTSDAFDDVDYDAWGIPTDFSPETSIMDTNSQSSPIEGTVNDNLAAGDQCVSDCAESLGSLSSSEVAYSTVLCERSVAKTEPLWSKSSLVSDNPSAKSPVSYEYAFETESYKSNSAGVAGCSFDSSMASQTQLVSCGGRQSMESNERETLEPKEVAPLNDSSDVRHGHISSARNRAIISLSSNKDEYLVSSIESGMEDIQLSDDTKLDETCILVDDNELRSLSHQLRRRSYKKRIQDFFGQQKRLAKEYEQLAIWYGDAEMEYGQGASETLSMVRFRRSLDSQNLQVLQASETEWELL